jgi:hypothetical protein
MVVMHSEGGRVEVNGGSVTMTKSLKKRTTVAHFEAGVEATACPGARDEVVACSGAGIEGDRWRQRCGSF